MKVTFKKLLKEVVLFAVILFVASNVISYFRAPKPQSNSLPDFDVVLMDGNDFNHQEAEGKPLIVHFWATWCPVCKTEASTIQSLSQTYQVLTIAVRSGSDGTLQNYMDENGYDFRVVNDREGVLAERFNVAVFPTTFIYDSSGRLKFTEVGYTTLLGFKGRLGVLK
jgi:thiol-disulfide isomerase/thioredoxin